MIPGLEELRPVCAGVANSEAEKPRWFSWLWRNVAVAPGVPAWRSRPDFKSVTLMTFLKQNVESGSTVYTDGLKSFTGLQEAGFKHVPRSQPLRTELRKGAKSVVPLADRAIGNLKQWLIGTHHGVIPFLFQDETNRGMVLSWHDHDRPTWTWWPERTT